jgi:SAM-dependent methyltransferase
MIDKAVAIKRTVAIRSRLKACFSLYWRKAKSTTLGWEIARDYRLDKKFGGWCGGIVSTPYPELNAFRTQSVHYWQLIQLFREVKIQESDFLVDVGCGKGRVINYWLHMGCKNRIVGVELNERVADRTRERLKGYPNVTIITGNILERIPPGASFFFLYNPFGESVMKQFNAVLSQDVCPAPDLRIVYYNCIHRDVFDNDPDWDVTDLTTRVVDKAVLLRPRAPRPASGSGPAPAVPR